MLCLLTLALLVPLALGRPARGYDTWNGYGVNFNETNVLQTAEVMSTSLAAGKYEYLVLDEGWSHDGNNVQWVLSPYGLPIPNPMRFPSAIDGTFTALANTLLTQYNLTLGLWLIRGIPKQAVTLNLTVFGTNYVMGDIINASRTCDWHRDAYALNMSHPGAQIYLDYMFSTYNSWGVRYFKVDCIFANNLDAEEIYGTAMAIKMLPKPSILSLSPGSNANAADVLKVVPWLVELGVASSYRITDDMWACWNTKQEIALMGQGWGHCILNTTRKVLDFIPFMKNGISVYPDGDMLPVGNFGTKWGPWPYGKLSPLTLPMLRFAFGLWSIARMPIILSGDLTTMGERTGAFAVANNPYLYAMHQYGQSQKLLSYVNTDPSDLNSIGYEIWLSQNPNVADGYYLGVFAFSENYNLTAPTAVQVAIPISTITSAAVRVFYMVSVWDDSVVTSLTDQWNTGVITLNVTVNDAEVLVLLPQS